MDGAAASKAQESDVYCSMFDLTSNKPLRAADRTRLHLIDVNELQDLTALPVDLYELLYQRLSELISSGGYSCVLHLSLLAGLTPATASHRTPLNLVKLSESLYPPSVLPPGVPPPPPSVFPSLPLPR